MMAEDLLSYEMRGASSTSRCEDILRMKKLLFILSGREVESINSVHGSSLSYVYFETKESTIEDIFLKAAIECRLRHSRF